LVGPEQPAPNNGPFNSSFQGLGGQNETTNPLAPTSILQIFLLPYEQPEVTVDLVGRVHSDCDGSGRTDTILPWRRKNLVQCIDLCGEKTLIGENAGNNTLAGWVATTSDRVVGPRHLSRRRPAPAQTTVLCPMPRSAFLLVLLPI